ncbi:hypothetical protein CFOL_v3_02639, partial [Cephalotus follicularis]
NCIVSCERVSF